jgi:hypothetical protein
MRSRIRATFPWTIAAALLLGAVAGCGWLNSKGAPDAAEIRTFEDAQIATSAPDKRLAPAAVDAGGGLQPSKTPCPTCNVCNGKKKMILGPLQISPSGTPEEQIVTDGDFPLETLAFVFMKGPSDLGVKKVLEPKGTLKVGYQVEVSTSDYPNADKVEVSWDSAKNVHHTFNVPLESITPGLPRCK